MHEFMIEANRVEGSITECSWLQIQVSKWKRNVDKDRRTRIIYIKSNLNEILSSCIQPFFPPLRKNILIKKMCIFYIKIIYLENFIHAN